MKKLAFLGCMAFVLISCNSGEKESSSTHSSEDNAAAATSNDGKTYDCLREFQEHYDKLLTKEDMASVYPIDFDAATVDLSAGNFGKHVYRWPSVRPEIEQEISGMKISIPDDNTLGVFLLSFYSEDSDLRSNRATFDMGYKDLSEKELKTMKENLDMQSKDVTEAGKKLLESRAKKHWDLVDGVGNSAWYKWNEQYGGELAVLAGRAKFYIRLKISDDPQENLDIAKKLAQKVLVKCD